MRISGWLIAATAGLSGLAASLSGCDQGFFPQYSGTFELVDSIYPEGKLATGLLLPSVIAVQDRMGYSGGSFNHYLTFETIGSTKHEASGKFTLAVSDAISPSQPFPTFKGSGVTFSMMRPGDHVGDWCYVNYHFTIFLDPAKMVPSLETMKKVYPGHKEYGGQEVNLSEAETLEIEPNVDAVIDWENQMAANGGITLSLQILKSAEMVVSGCTERMPYVEPIGSVTGIYTATDSYEASSRDIRKNSTDGSALRAEVMSTANAAAEFARSLMDITYMPSYQN